MDDNTKAALDEIFGRLVAQEFALKMLMLTHANNAAVGKLWDMYLPTQIDDWIESPDYSSNARFRDALHRHVASLREMLDIKVPGFQEEP